MKIKNTYRVVFILSICFLSTNQITLGQRTKAILTFKDGTTLRGLGKLKGNERVKFRKDKKSKAKKYHFKDLKSVDIYEGSMETCYVYLYVIEKKEYKVLQEVIIGEVSLYKTVAHGQHVGMGFGGVNGLGGMGMGGSFTIEGYYLRRKGEEKVSHLSSTGAFSKNFKKSAGNYFKDCPELLEKINNKEFKKRDIEAVVEYYNSNCIKE